jgi:hypothetical protein
MLREVPVRVDTVTELDRPVPVVVAEVLPPEPRVRALERVLVAVGVGDRHEPELRLAQELLDLRVVRVPARDVPAEQADVDLTRDPLARMLQRAVEHGGLGTVPLRSRVLRQLQRQDLPALQCVADHLELGDRRVVRSDLVQLRPYPSGPS